MTAEDKIEKALSEILPCYFGFPEFGIDEEIPETFVCFTTTKRYTNFAESKSQAVDYSVDLNIITVDNIVDEDIITAINNAMRDIDYVATEEQYVNTDLAEPMRKQYNIMYYNIIQ